jgi:ribosomal protein L11 methyltransferase
MTKYYKEFLISADPFITDIISSVLWNLDIEGISEEVNCIKVFSRNLNLTSIDFESVLNKLVSNNLLRSFEIQENTFVEKNWNEEWEKSREVNKISDKIVIKPSFKEYQSKEDEIVIVIDPKMSFGTGDHQTTKICINFLEKYLQPSSIILDAGSGTAILSIVSAKLGAKKVIAFDIDEWSLSNGIENIKLNQVDDIVEVRLCELQDIKEKEFDIIVANIQRNILLELASGFIKKLKQNGILILSGLLEADYEIIKNHYSSFGMKEIDFIQNDEWIGIVFRK